MQFGERRQRVKATLLNMGVTEAVFEILLDVGGALMDIPSSEVDLQRQYMPIQTDSNIGKYAALFLCLLCHALRMTEIKKLLSI